MLMFCRQHSYLVAVSKSAFSIIDNQLVFLLEQLQNRYLLHLACHPHILELVAGSAYAEMMGAYPGPQILLLERFQTHRQFVNKAQFEDSFTSQLMQLQMLKRTLEPSQCQLSLKSRHMMITMS